MFYELIPFNEMVPDGYRRFEGGIIAGLVTLIRDDEEGVGGEGGRNDNKSPGLCA